VLGIKQREPRKHFAKQIKEFPRKQAAPPAESPTESVHSPVQC